MAGLKTAFLLRLQLKRAHRAARVAAKAAFGLLHRHHPILVHIIPMRRCNLACAYCNEYDDVSQPVPLDAMLRRLDKLAELGTAMITVSGGEPLMHPDLDVMLLHMRKRGMVSSLITNGYYLSPERIGRLNRAGLDYLQISIDNVEPDEISMKSLRLLEPKLSWLAEHAEFGININSVVGGGIKNPEDALAVARRARALGFTSTIGILHDGRGQLRGLGEREMAVYRELKRIGSRSDARVNALFQDNLAEGRPNQWACRAGARYLYVDEDGLVHYCSQQRGAPGLPLEQYTLDDIRREYDTRKGCAPYCTINCVQRVALFDNWRSPQRSRARLPGRAAASLGRVAQRRPAAP
ncbi:MAG TPA: radical SAM protein [Vicinamibacteria bacterium]|jgi:MoaA/NifB/PqqE/SkfB family radical SAM enzyme